MITSQKQSKCQTGLKQAIFEGLVFLFTIIVLVGAIIIISPANGLQ